MITNLILLPSAGAGAAFASLTPGGTLLIEEPPQLAAAAAVAAALTSLPGDFPVLGDLLITNVTAPPTPSTGQSRLYVDSSLKQLALINDTGAINYLAPVTMASLPADAVASAFEFVLDGAGLSLVVNQLSPYFIAPTAATITGVTLLADQSGSITVDIWKCSYANFNPGTHPVVADSITASDVPAIASTYKYTDASLTGWTTAINANDVLVCNVKVAAVNITRVTVALQVKKT